MQLEEALREEPTLRRSASQPSGKGSEPPLSAVLRFGVHAITAAVFAWPLTEPVAVVAAAVGAGAGTLVGRRMARTRFRLGVLLSVAFAVLGLALVANRIVVGTEAVAVWLGPAGALRAGETVLFGVGALAVSWALRVTSARHRAMMVLEAAFVAVAFGQLVIAHRHGAINRPFPIADPIIAQGGDPTFAFLGIGVLATAVIVLLLLSERSPLRSLLHLAMVALILLVVVGTASTVLPPPPPTGAGLGLRPDKHDGHGKDKSDRGKRRNNEQLQFKDDYTQSSQRVPVAVVVFRDDYSPPSGVYYFRQGAFSQYNGRRLVAATARGVDDDIATGFPAGGPMIIPDAPSAGEYRTTVDTTVGLLADHTRAFGLASPVRFAPAPNPDPRRFRRTYEAVSAVLTADYASMLGHSVGDPKWPAAERRNYLEAPSDPRYRKLADRIVQEMLPQRLRADPIAKALAIQAWLSKKGTYSLKSRHAHAADPTADFLFGDLTGYCVHFAHAATYLMRTLGLPSRVATGYAVPESVRRGGSALMLTGSDSHAWPELYVDGFGWVVVDVQPQKVITPPPAPPDPDLQRLLGELLRGENPFPPDANPVLPRIASMARQWLVDSVVAGLGLVAAAFLLLFVGKLWRRAAPMWARGEAMPRVAYRAELDRLSEVALRRLRGESREAFAARVAATVPSFGELTRLHVGAAFGSRRARAAVARVRERAGAVRTELRGAVPWWRRLIGVLTPWSWLLAR